MRTTMMCMLFYHFSLVACTLLSNEYIQLGHLIGCHAILVKGYQKLCARIHYFGFQGAKIKAGEIAQDSNIDKVFRFPAQETTKDYEATDEPLSGAEKFKNNFLLVLVDTALMSLNERFKQTAEFPQLFGFVQSKCAFGYIKVAICAISLRKHWNKTHERRLMQS